MVLDGVEQAEYDEKVVNLYFSPNGKRLAWLARQDGKQFMVVDGRKEKEYDRISGYNFFNMGSPMFSPDSKHLAYSAKKGLMFCIVFDGN